MTRKRKIIILVIILIILFGVIIGSIFIIILGIIIFLFRTTISNFLSYIFIQASRKQGPKRYYPYQEYTDERIQEELKEKDINKILELYPDEEI